MRISTEPKQLQESVEMLLKRQEEETLMLIYKLQN